MTETLLTHAMALRLGVFLAAFVAIALIEHWRPFRAAGSRLRRWSSGFGLLLIGSGILRVAFPLLAVGAGIWVEYSGFGLLQRMPLPYALTVLLGIIALDLAIYLQHVAFHRFAWLWRMHRVHHSDTAFDVSTGIRFHPLEIALSMSIKICIVVLLGIPAMAVLLWEILLNAFALFSHANFALPEQVDALLRRLLVTPDMHRVHHSVRRHETNSNYGNVLSVWDRLLGTYRARSEVDSRLMPIGLMAFREDQQQHLLPLLLQPLQAKDAYPGAAPEND